MLLELTGDQQLLVDTTRKYLAARSHIAAVRALADHADGFTPDWWVEGAELGWMSLLAPVELGGGGVSSDALSDLVQVAFERGRVVAPGPFASANAALVALGAMPGASTWIERVVAGSAIVTLAVDERGARWPARNISTTITRQGAGVVVNGVKRLVETAGCAAGVVVAGQGADGVELALVRLDAPGVEIRPLSGTDLVRRFYEVRFDEVPIEADLIADPRTVEVVLDVATVLQLAETVGAIDRVLEFTIEWAFDRYTFGRPLASYQELKHRFADMTLWLEASKATVTEAAVAVSERREDAAELVSAAASYVDEHGSELVQDCVQMHGGIGVTWEHDIHLFLRRVTTNALTFGTVADHRERLAGIVLEGTH